jgi:hypothetical protein
MEVLALGFSRTGLSPYSESMKRLLTSTRNNVYVPIHLALQSKLTLEALKRALEKLGYSVYHMEECVTRWKEKHIHLFEEATRAKLLGQGKLWTGAELDKVLQNYTVSVANPANFCY